MNTHRAVPTSTQEAHPWRSVVRTFVAAAVGVALAWLVRALGVDLTPLSESIINSLTAAAWAVGTAFVQWLLTRPWAQPFLEAVGLGTGVHTEQRALAENLQRAQGGDG
ncbi:hypothetical protein [Brachybacterium paraconglomeratum]|uniref:hypothetical protein n=1 Tax=Brachybacterium paraconglomeratum TaxID=173362 RepID=UPI00026C69CA|nr:hypothetical protein [Brachybacterium paraconglomeratum]